MALRPRSGLQDNTHNIWYHSQLPRQLSSDRHTITRDSDKSERLSKTATPPKN